MLLKVFFFSVLICRYVAHTYNFFLYPHSFGPLDSRFLSQVISIIITLFYFDWSFLIDCLVSSLKIFSRHLVIHIGGLDNISWCWHVRETNSCTIKAELWSHSVIFLQASSLEFLCQHNFDFNKVLTKIRGLFYRLSINWLTERWARPPLPSLVWSAFLPAERGLADYLVLE